MHGPSMPDVKPRRSTMKRPGSVFVNDTPVTSKLFGLVMSTKIRGGLNNTSPVAAGELWTYIVTCSGICACAALEIKTAESARKREVLITGDPGHILRQ